MCNGTYVEHSEDASYGPCAHENDPDDPCRFLLPDVDIQREEEAHPDSASEYAGV
jgi:hypothetical protein